MKKSRIDFLTWRYLQFAWDTTPKQLANSFSVEALPSDELPYRFRKALTGFRHLSQVARVATCKAFLLSYRKKI